MLPEIIDFELDTVVQHIKKIKARSVCVQLADGLKPKAGEIVDEIKKQTGADVFIWAGSCFGACDVPNINGFTDILIQFGHEFIF